MIGNFFIPMMIGAKDLAFPKLNLASWYVFMIGAVFAVWSVLAGGIDTGLDALPAVQHAVESQPNVVPGVVGVFIIGLQLDHDRAEHHGDDPQDALPRA